MRRLRFLHSDHTANRHAFALGDLPHRFAARPRYVLGARQGAADAKKEATMNTDYGWGGSLFRTRNDMLDAIAEAWATAWGHASPAETQRNFDEATDAELAAEAIAGWGLDCGTGWCGEGEPHMTQYGYDATDLAAAFGRVRERLGEAAPAA
jgi:hypothetical protein